MNHQSVAELLSERCGRPVEPRVVEQLLRRTDADPALIAAVADQIDPNSDGLHRIALRWPDEQIAAVRAATGTLSPAALVVVSAACVIGREFDLAILELTCPDQDLLGGLEEAERAGLIRTLPAQVFAFVRALQREVCYDALGARQRAQWHERAGAALVRLGALGGSRAATVIELAHHTAEAAALGGVDRLDAAVAASATAGAAMADEGVYDLAGGYFAQAALFAGRAGWPPGPAGRLLAASGTARVRAATDPAVLQAGRSSLTGALRLGQRVGDAGLIAVAALGLGPRPTPGALAPDGPGPGADTVRRDALVQALATAPADGAYDTEGGPGAARLDVSTAARLSARLALETRDTALARRALAQARVSGDPRAVAEALLALADTATTDTAVTDGAELAQAVREADALADPELLARAYDLAARAAVRVGGTARAEAQRLLVALAALGGVRPTALVRWYAVRAAVELALLRGEPVEPGAVTLAYAAGQAVDPAVAQVWQQAVLAFGPRERSAAGLTVREQEVLVWALRGTPAKDIAEGLFLGERTVETHLASIYRKLGVRTRIELIRKFGDGSSLL